MLILTISKNFHKLFENCGLTSIAALRELSGIVEMAKNLTIMLIVAVLCSKYRWAYGARKVIDVVFLIQCCDIRPSERPIAFMTDQVQPPEIVSLAQGVLPVAAFVVDWEEL